jgi:uncharacterized protein
MDRTYFAYPFHLDNRGRAATTGPDEHVRQMIEQVLFTNPGERVNRPDLGCGIKALLFQPNSDVLAATTQLLVKAALQKWLEHEIQVETVEVRAQDERLEVTIAYFDRALGERRVDSFQGPV